MTGIVLSGGENRRMGADKAFLKIAGRPIIERVLDVLRPLFRQIIIVTNSPELYNAYNVIVVTDALDARGPLTGIYSGLRSAEDEHGFVAACDMPFLNPRLISYMKGLAHGHDAVVPRVNGMAEPLHAVYSRSMLPAIEAMVKQDIRQIRKAFDGANVRYVTDAEVDRFDPERRSFINLNTPGEYKEALCLE